MQTANASERICLSSLWDFYSSKVEHLNIEFSVQRVSERRCSMIAWITHTSSLLPVSLHSNLNHDAVSKRSDFVSLSGWGKLTRPKSPTPRSEMQLRQCWESHPPRPERDESIPAVRDTGCQWR